VGADAGVLSAEIKLLGQPTFMRYRS
jgi:hypothetical protein